MIDVRECDSFVDSIIVCYRNGGQFVNLLDRFNYSLSKKLLEKEKSKEQAYGSILTLTTMFALNIFLIVSFTFQNVEYANIMRNTFVGRAILDINAISYLAIGYMVLKIYKLEV